MSDRLTVVQLTNSRTPSGGTRQALRLSRGLTERGHRVVFCAPADSGTLRSAAEAGLETRALSFGGLWDQWRSSRRLRRLAREVGADVVHAHHTKGHNVALLATFGGGFPPVVANRGVLFRPEFPARYASRRTAAVITNSRAVKGVLAAAGVPADKVHVVYNACAPWNPAGAEEDLARLRRELDLDVPGPVVGAVGRARPEKGFAFLVEAAPRILEALPSAVFLLIGTGSPRLAPRVAELGLSERFRLSGHRPDAARAMGLLDLLAFPSIGMDSCPNVVLEAMAAGVPVVGTAIGGVPEIVVDGETGRIVPPGDAGALAGAAVEVLSDRARARAMGERGRTRAAADFTLEAKVDGTLRVYGEILGRGGEGGRR